MTYTRSRLAGHLALGLLAAAALGGVGTAQAAQMPEPKQPSKFAAERIAAAQAKRERKAAKRARGRVGR